jgi:Skp family chaperone for outer membrane proteins
MVNWRHPVAAILLAGCALSPGVSGDLLLTRAAVAQTAAQGVFTLNQELFFSQSAFGLRVRQVTEEKSAEIAAENRNIEDELRVEEQALTDLRPSLTPAEFRVQADTFDQKVEAIRNRQALKSADLNAWIEAERQRFFASALPELSKIAVEVGAAVVLDRRATILSSDVNDLTNLAVERVDSVFGDGAVPPEQ